MESATRLAAMRHVGDRTEARLERVFGHDRQAIWQMLTDPERLAEWLAPGSIELRPGGRVEIDFADSGTTIASSLSRFEPPRLLAYSWSSDDEPERPLQWELTALGAETRLALTVDLPAGEDAAKACAGFAAHLEMLAAALEGVPIRFPVEHFLEARRFYQGMVPERAGS